MPKICDGQEWSMVHQKPHLKGMSCSNVKSCWPCHWKFPVIGRHRRRAIELDFYSQTGHVAVLVIRR